jgi:hypothetical protein
VILLYSFYREVDILGHYRECRAKVLCEQLVKVQPKELSVYLGSYLGDAAGDHCAEAPGTQVYMVGRSASVRAATRVKPEQASKAVMRESSRPENGEDHWRQCGRTEAHRRTRRGIGRSTYTGPTTQRGRSVTVQGDPLQLHNRWRLGQKSEEPIRARKPGNAGGAKGLWFGVRRNEANERGLA